MNTPNPMIYPAPPPQRVAPRWNDATYRIIGPLLPLNRPRRLARHVVHHPVHALHLVDDAGGGLAEKLHVELVKVRGHAVGGGDGAQAHDEVVGAAVAHDAHRLHREQHGKGLPDVVVETVLADLVDVDGIGLAQDVEFFAGDVAGAADGEAGARERVAADEDFGQAELAAELAHFVLEQLAQRLDQLHVHALRKTADIVVRLDRHRGAAGEGDALDHVEIG